MGVQECAVSFAFVVFRGGAVPTFRENKREWKDISNIRDGKKREKELLEQVNQFQDKVKYKDKDR